MTFSIAGLCPRTGAYGCAMATSSMAAGARAVFVAPGAGVVLSQARSDPRLGEIGLARLRAGDDARAAIAAMVAASPHAAWRQLAVLDLRGGKAANTGEHCTEAKGERFGDGVIAVGNGLANESVVGAMIEGYAMAADRSLPDRLIAGLEAGLAAGGEAPIIAAIAPRASSPACNLASPISPSRGSDRACDSTTPAPGDTNTARAPAAIDDVAIAQPYAPVRGQSPAIENVMRVPLRHCR